MKVNHDLLPIVLQVNQSKKFLTGIHAKRRSDILLLFVVQCTLVKVAQCTLVKQCILVKSDELENVLPFIYSFYSLLRRGSSVRYNNPLCEEYRRRKVEWIVQAENLRQMYVDFSYILVVFSYIDGFLDFG